MRIGCLNTKEDWFHRCVLVVLSFKFLPLVKYSEGIVFDGVFAFLDYFTTIKAFPPFKVNKMIEERLHDHQSSAFWASHRLLPRFYYYLLYAVPESEPVFTCSPKIIPQLYVTITNLL